LAGSRLLSPCSTSQMFSRRGPSLGRRRTRHHHCPCPLDTGPLVKHEGSEKQLTTRKRCFPGHRWCKRSSDGESPERKRPCPQTHLGPSWQSSHCDQMRACEVWELFLRSRQPRRLIPTTLLSMRPSSDHQDWDEPFSNRPPHFPVSPRPRSLGSWRLTV
jgi:hypothetical protein